MVGHDRVADEHVAIVLSEVEFGVSAAVANREGTVLGPRAEMID
jgi:hypothetical protein